MINQTDPPEVPLQGTLPSLYIEEAEAEKHDKPQEAAIKKKGTFHEARSAVMTAQPLLLPLHPAHGHTASPLASLAPFTDLHRGLSNVSEKP